MIFSACLRPPKQRAKRKTSQRGFAQAGNRCPLFGIMLCAAVAPVEIDVYDRVGA
jgi:hypothetical protein